MTSEIRRRLPVGAEPQRNGGVHFRVWAPKRSRVDVVLDNGKTDELTRERTGHFSGLIGAAAVGTRYGFRLDGADPIPDPASRAQPEGPHKFSLVVDPHAYAWSDRDWSGLARDGQVLYEMHIGTFTSEGSWRAAADHLQALADLGITALEIMPVAEFPGRFGWGYDGVALFAPYHHYGSCDDFRAFVDRAHATGLGVILDVVYNHFGPDGNYLAQFSDTYFNKKRTTDWGDAINYDGDGSEGVRELVLANARMWIAEYHLDGLRLDATQNIYDDTTPNILREIAEVARRAAGKRELLLVAESEPQDARLVRSEDRDGFALDALWCDDFHHSAMVAATGRREAYFTDYRGTAQEFVSLVKYGPLYQGQFYSWQKNRRGSPALDLAPRQCVTYLENHDQVANSFDGRRLHQLTSPGRYRALTALLLLAPQMPMLFQGQEFGSSAPFLFFADHHAELAKLVRGGRSQFLAQFPSLAVADVQRRLTDPGDPTTFERSRIDHGERGRHPEHLALHRDLISLRRCDPLLSRAGYRVDGAVLGESAFVLRFFGARTTGDSEGRGAQRQEGDRLLVINLGADLALDSAPEPLLVPENPERGWRRLWYSDDPCYGGRGAWQIESNGVWRLPAESATLLSADG